MPFNKTTLKRMKKDQLVEHILKIQEDNETTALFSSNEKLIEGAMRFCHKLPDAEENKRLKKENEELASIIKKMDERMIDLRRIKNDITAHPDYERLISIEENQ